MRSKITEHFRQRLDRLPANIKRQTLSAYRRWKEDPTHPGLEFKEIRINSTKVVWSARINRQYRALGYKPEADLVVWIWVGSHAEYDKLVDARRSKSI